MSLPIPTRMPSLVRFIDLPPPRPAMVQDLTRGRIDPGDPCHLDPDIDARLLRRARGWRGAFGQAGAAQGHLHRHTVGPGDLFLFWGLFRRVSRSDRWQFEGRREHRIFGWLQVGEVLHLGPDPRAAKRKYPWLARHPHLQPGWGANNTIYVAAETLRIGGRGSAAPGWGVFESGYPLTDPSSRTPSTWRVPDWLNPARGGVGLTYHPPRCWQRDGTLLAASRGQEFIADIEARGDALKWLRSLFADALAAFVGPG